MTIRIANVRTKTLLAVLLAALAANVSAQVVSPAGTTVVETGPGRGVATTTSVVSAMVLAVDLSSRAVSLRLADGRELAVVAGREVRNLENLKPGDVVNVAYIDSLVLQLKKSGTFDVSRTETSDVTHAPRGAKPGGVIQNQVTVVADVVAVDEANGTVTLRGPQRTVSVRIKDPAQVALIEVGDQVEATYTEAVAVAVDPAR